MNPFANEILDRRTLEIHGLFPRANLHYQERSKANEKQPANQLKSSDLSTREKEREGRREGDKTNKDEKR